MVSSISTDIDVIEIKTARDDYVTSISIELYTDTNSYLQLITMAADTNVIQVGDPFPDRNLHDLLRFSRLVTSIGELSLCSVLRELRVKDIRFGEECRECFGQLLAEAWNLITISTERSWLSPLLQVLAPKTEEDGYIVPCPYLDALVIQGPESAYDPGLCSVLAARASLGIKLHLLVVESSHEETAPDELLDYVDEVAHEE